MSPVPEATDYGRIPRFPEDPACARAGSPSNRSVAIVRESEREGVTVSQVAKKHGITETTLFRWRKRFSGLTASQVAGLRRLQQENARLKKLVAERDLDIEVLKEINARNW